MMVQDKELVSMREAATIAGVTEQTIRYWVRARKLTLYKHTLRRGMMVDANELRRKLTDFTVDPAKEQE